MKKLFVAVISLFLLLPVASYIFVVSSEGDNKEARKFFESDRTGRMKFIGFPGKAMGVDDPKWERENVFINDNLTELLGREYEIKNFFSVKKEANNKPVKVLLFGDGYTWGNANTDRYSTVSALVQSKLDEKLGKNVVDVVVRSISAAGTYNHHDYFKDNADKVKEINPDVVIYNFFDNDINPGFNESIVCRSTPIDKCMTMKMSAAELEPKYQDCIHGEGDKYSRVLGRFKGIAPRRVYNNLIKHCAPLLEYAKKHEYNWLSALAKPYTSPYIGLWERTVKDLRSFFGERKVAVVKLVPMGPTLEDEKKMLDAYKNGGWEIVPMSITRDYFIKNLNQPNFQEELKINPSVAYPSSLLNSLYAEDISNYVINSVSKERIKEAKVSAKRGYSSNEPVVKFTMPVYEVDNQYINESESRIIFNKSALPIYNQDPDQGQGGEASPFQYTNCYNLKSGNFIFVLNKELRSGFVSLHNLPKNEVMEIGAYTYDKEYKRIYTPLGKYSEGMKIRVPESSIGTSLALIFPEHSKGCEMDKVIEIPDFDIRVKFSKY